MGIKTDASVNNIVTRIERLADAGAKLAEDNYCLLRDLDLEFLGALFDQISDLSAELMLTEFEDEQKAAA